MNVVLKYRGTFDAAMAILFKYLEHASGEQYILKTTD